MIVGATINPDGLETDYEIELECGAACGSQPSKKTGSLPATDTGQEVSLALAGLSPGSYWFEVHASNTAGRTSRRASLTVPQPPPGACPSGCRSEEPYKSEIPQWSIELNEAESAKTVQEYEAKQRQIAREREEQEAKEKASLPAEEPASPAPPVPCVVPSLRDDTLSAARRALKKARCKLGEVVIRRRGRGVLRVVGQSPAYRAKLASGAPVTVTLGAVRHRRHRRK